MLQVLDYVEASGAAPSPQIETLSDHIVAVLQHDRSLQDKFRSLQFYVHVQMQSHRGRTFENPEMARTLANSYLADIQEYLSMTTDHERIFEGAAGEACRETPALAPEYPKLSLPRTLYRADTAIQTEDPPPRFMVPAFFPNLPVPTDHTRSTSGSPWLALAEYFTDLHAMAQGPSGPSLFPPPPPGGPSGPSAAAPPTPTAPAGPSAAAPPTLTAPAGPSAAAPPTTAPAPPTATGPLDEYPWAGWSLPTQVPSPKRWTPLKVLTSLRSIRDLETWVAHGEPSLEYLLGQGCTITPWMIPEKTDLNTIPLWRLEQDLYYNCWRHASGVWRTVSSIEGPKVDLFEQARRGGPIYTSPAEESEPLKTGGYKILIQNVPLQATEHLVLDLLRGDLARLDPPFLLRQEHFACPPHLKPSGQVHTLQVFLTLREKVHAEIIFRALWKWSFPHAKSGQAWHVAVRFLHGASGY